MGYERWLPSPPKVEKPRSMFNAAYIGDLVRCEAQDAVLQKLIDDNYLSQEERDVLRWGRNIGSAKMRTKRRVAS
ncbi:mini-ribonuclease 3 [Olea europaea subsp. europaea]|uniref:Mini-ribonuclease 3 n=1 Tax=Olea europaea subsp. europaea TaxID=158383 RepID=A0A8S0TXJ0_OLEEU|nr:mini-ribonuclease 3 [Olea europaea subsp. europaea]